MLESIQVPGLRAVAGSRSHDDAPLLGTTQSLIITLFRALSTPDRNYRGRYAEGGIKVYEFRLVIVRSAL